MKAELNTQDSNGCTPVWIAAKKDHADALRVLKEFGADVNTTNIYGCTPVYVAAQNSHTDAIRVLKEFGADVNTPNINGCTQCGLLPKMVMSMRFVY